MSFVFDYSSFVSVEKDTLKRNLYSLNIKVSYFGMICGKVDTKKKIIMLSWFQKILIIFIKIDL